MNYSIDLHFLVKTANDRKLSAEEVEKALNVALFTLREFKEYMIVAYYLEECDEWEGPTKPGILEA